jgi:hypothetical protein
MDWPKSAGKGVEAYVADEASRLTRVKFEEDTRKYIGSALSSKLSPADFQVLFEISDDYVRRYRAVSGMKNKDRFLKDFRARTALMADTRKWLADFRKDLDPRTLDKGKPVAALLARSVYEKVSKLQHTLEKEFEAIELHQRLSKTMLRTLSLKHMRTSYVAQLNSYIEDVAFRDLPSKRKGANTERLIAGVMSAAGLFSAAEKVEGLQQGIHMARWRAKEFIESENNDDSDVQGLQSTPRTKTAL